MFSILQFVKVGLGICQFFTSSFLEETCWIGVIKRKIYKSNMDSVNLPKRLSAFVSPILRKDHYNVFGDVLKRWFHRCNVAPKVVVKCVEHALQ